MAAPVCLRFSAMGPIPRRGGDHLARGFEKSSPDLVDKTRAAVSRFLWATAMSGPHNVGGKPFFCC